MIGFKCNYGRFLSAESAAGVGFPFSVGSIAAEGRSLVLWKPGLELLPVHPTENPRIRINKYVRFIAKKMPEVSHRHVEDLRELLLIASGSLCIGCGLGFLLGGFATTTNKGESHETSEGRENTTIH